MSLPQTDSRQTHDTVAQKIANFHEARGSFESHYIDDNVTRETQAPFSQPVLKRTPRTPTQTSSTQSTNKASSSSSTSSRITHSSHSTLDSVPKSNAPRPKPNPNTTVSNYFTRSQRPSERRSAASRQGPVSRTTTATAKRPVAHDSNYLKNNTLKYPRHTHQNCLDMRWSQFNNLKADDPPTMTDNDVKEDFEAMDIDQPHPPLPQASITTQPTQGIALAAAAVEQSNAIASIAATNTTDVATSIDHEDTSMVPSPSQLVRSASVSPPQSQSEQNAAAISVQSQTEDVTPLADQEETIPPTREASNVDEIPAMPSSAAAKPKRVTRRARKKPTTNTLPSKVTKKPTKKAAAPHIILSTYRGIPSGHGYPINPPPEAELDVPWQCGELFCTSGMSWLPCQKAAKEGQACGRKVISDFFGRNKTSTKLIPDDVWHWTCRKHYQRERYAQVKQDAKQICLWQIEALKDQLIRLKFWRPEARYKIRVMAAADERLNNWYRLLYENAGDREAAKQAMPVPPVQTKKVNNSRGKKGADGEEELEEKLRKEHHFPIEQLEHFSRAFVGENKSYDDIDATINWLKQQIEADHTAIMCPMEFLVQEKAFGELVNDTRYNFQQWEAAKSGKTFDVATAYTPGQETHVAANDDGDSNGGSDTGAAANDDNAAAQSMLEDIKEEEEEEDENETGIMEGGMTTAGWKTVGQRPISSTLGAMPGPGPQTPAHSQGQQHTSPSSKLKRKADDDTHGASPIDTPTKKKPRIKALHVTQPKPSFLYGTRGQKCSEAKKSPAELSGDEEQLAPRMPREVPDQLQASLTQGLL